MSQHRKPLLRFETGEKAQLISASMPSSGSVRRRKTGKRKSTGPSKKPRVIKGRVNLRVPGYHGLQKVAPSSLIPFLPSSKLRQAAKKALIASGSNKTKVVKRRKKRSRKTRKG
jgi:hypothetical protein